MKKFISDINKNINLETSLPLYADYLINLYNKRAAVELSMDYYTYQGMIMDNIPKDEFLIRYTKQFNEIISGYVKGVCGEEKAKEAIKKIDTLRNNVYNIVEVLTAYADIFSRYEYIANRCEYLFREADISDKYTDEDFTRQIMQYIFADEDNAVINAKICEIIAELPFRLTKNKFFELLSDGMSVYSKTDKVTIDDFIYLIRSSAMLTVPEGMNQYGGLWEICEGIREIDYSSLDKNTFEEVSGKLKYAADFIDNETNRLMLLQGLINKAYVLIVTDSYTDHSDKVTQAARTIITEINQHFYGEDYLTLEEDITDRFIFMEGIPEELNNAIQSVEYVLDNVKNSHMSTVQNIKADKLYNGLFLCEKLLSDSLFIDLSSQYLKYFGVADEITDIHHSDSESSVNETNDINSEKHVNNSNIDTNEEFDTEKYLITKRDELISELMAFFKDNQKQVNRSVMSLILSKLPVFFNNITEVQDYIYNALSNCTNKAEKYASIEIIKSIIEI